MREPITEEQVERAFAAVNDCLDRLEAHYRRCVDQSNRLKLGSTQGPVEVPPEEMKDIVRGLRVVAKARRVTAGLLEPLDRELPILHAEPVDSRGLLASSWAEIVVLVATRYVEFLEYWERFGKLVPDRQRFLLSRVMDLVPDVSRCRASLRIEEAGLRERGRAARPEVRYAYEFDHLKGQSRRLFRYLTENQGRRIEKQEIAESVIGNADASDGSIHTAMSRLRAQLVAFGSERSAASITEEGGAYRFQ